MDDFDLLLEHARYIESFSDGIFHADAFIAIKDGTIVGTGPMRDLPPAARAAQHLDVSSLLIIPGLINCHNHSAMTLFRGLADDLPLMKWLMEHIFPAESRAVNPEMVYWCSKLAAAEMLLSGTTTVADGYFHEIFAAKAFAEAGMRAVAAQGVIDFPAPGVPDPANNIAHAQRFIMECRSFAPRVRPGVFCHSPYTCGAATILDAKRLALEQQVPFFIHVAETEVEVLECTAKHGRSPVDYLHHLGVLDASSILVHGVWLSDSDIALLASLDVPLVSCPKSNMKLASGVAPLSKLLGTQVRVALGTDGAASNNGLDLFSEMGSCACLHKGISRDPTVVSASTMLGLATSGAASVLGLADQVGLIKVGQRADLVGIDTTRLNLTPLYSVESLVYSCRGADVDLVLVDGELLVVAGELLSIDLAETIAMVRQLARKLA